MKRFFLTFIIMALAIVAVSAQKNERAYLRKGNRLYRDSSYVQSEVMYRKALDINNNSFVAHNNLGNNLLKSRKYEDAVKEYLRAIECGADKQSLSNAYYNMGVALQKQQKYQDCINAYKNALKNDPDNVDAKYNLTKALMMQQNQQNQDNQQQDQQQKEQQQQQEQNKDNNENKNDQNKPEEQDNQEQQPSDSSQGEQEDMSKENAEQILKAIMEDEKRVNEEVQKKINRTTGQDLENNW